MLPSVFTENDVGSRAVRNGYFHVQLFDNSFPQPQVISLYCFFCSVIQKGGTTKLEQSKELLTFCTFVAC